MGNQAVAEVEEPEVAVIMLLEANHTHQALHLMREVAEALEEEGDPREVEKEDHISQEEHQGEGVADSLAQKSRSAPKINLTCSLEETTRRKPQRNQATLTT